ncbi:hypothetical protein DL764_010856 [Monosporascus ibericus]|uniref:lytic cellulose monooxygenase (C4-dehydrogenating) n=1 Tax=Monosporascus ibericus TaxID=155417 RepID=A0A4Q4SUD7_9PEZI|nr:hypothetical protein DL764_010856 [Monosporascus ibericus]
MDVTGIETVDVVIGSIVNFNPVKPISHPGPVNFYMAKAPTGASLAEFHELAPVWFKIYSDGPEFTSSGTLTWPTEFAETIPSSSRRLGGGVYLLRVVHIGLHLANFLNGAQLYVVCAHISVSSGTGTMRPNLLSFPGAYSPEDPGFFINIYHPFPRSYTPPVGDVLVC